MKIIATTRTRNEEENIERFCLAYGAFCDEILISDGGSDDRTVEIARSMPKTFVYHFKEKVWNDEKTHWRNPHGKHINSCIKRAIRRGADWIIFDDCDSVPNLNLQKTNYFTFENDILKVFRLYLLGEDQRLTKMESETSLWAWRSEIPVRANTSDPWKHEWIIPKAETFHINYPDVLLHYFAPTTEKAEKKAKFYRDSGELPGMTTAYDINSMYWPPEKAPDWAVWK